MIQNRSTHNPAKSYQCFRTEIATNTMANPLYELLCLSSEIFCMLEKMLVYVFFKAGKATVSLHLDLGDPSPTPVQPHGRPYHQRNSPSQRRAAARLAGQWSRWS